MKYTREYLKKIDESNWGSAEHHAVTQNLINRLQSKQALTLSEADYACQIYSQLNPNFQTHPLDYDACISFWFKDRYMNYFEDIEGIGEVEDHTGFLSPEQKSKDVAFLEKCHQEWVEITRSNRHKNSLLNHLVSETNYQLTQIQRHCKKNALDNNRESELKKAILLHSRYIFIIVSEYFEDFPKQEQAIEIFGKKIVIDSFAHIHILFRHYAKALKEHQMDKSYHFDLSIDYKEIPTLIFSVLSMYKQLGFMVERNLDFELRGQQYSIWLRPMKRSVKGIGEEAFLRVQTFYPVDMEPDLTRIGQKRKISLTNELAILV